MVNPPNLGRALGLGIGLAGMAMVASWILCPRCGRNAQRHPGDPCPYCGHVHRAPARPRTTRKAPKKKAKKKGGKKR